MKPLPTILSSTDFLSIPNDDPKEAQRALLSIAEKSYQTMMSAKVISKINKTLQNSILLQQKMDPLVGQFLESSIKDWDNALTELSVEGVYFGFGTKNSMSIEDLSKTMEAFHSNLSHQMRGGHLDSSLSQSAERLIEVTSTNLAFLRHLPSKLTTVPSYPKLADMPEIGQVNDEKVKTFDDSALVGIDKHKRTIEMNGLPVSMSLNKRINEHGRVTLMEEWAVDGKAVRPGGLPPSLRLSYQSINDNPDAKFSLSHPVLMHDIEHRNSYIRFVEENGGQRLSGTEKELLVARIERQANVQLGDELLNKQKAPETDLSPA